MSLAGGPDSPNGETPSRTRDASNPAVDTSGTNAPIAEKHTAPSCPIAHETLKHSLLGPSLLKAGQESVNQAKVSEIIYNASKGSKYFDREEEKDKTLSLKIEQTLAKKAQLERQDLSHDLRLIDGLISRLDQSRDLTQYIVHVDCDAFYAAVELLGRPELADVPFAVGGGVLATCNYVARRFGCRSGMASFVAKKLCPQLVLLKPDFTKYNAKAQEVRQILAEYDPRFESASIDEAYLNITQYCSAHNTTPAEAVERLRGEISEKTKVTVSAGIAANARLAKICSNMNKPNGQYLLPNDRSTVLAFMKDLPCRRVNGIGRVFERELAAVGIKTCGDIFEQRMFLSQLYGDKACHFLIQAYLGLGRTRVQPPEESDRKSIGTESTFPSISDPESLRQKLRWTAEELERDMRRAACKGRTLVLKIKLHTFEVYTRQVVAPRALLSACDFYNQALPMLGKLEQEIPGMTVRLMGLRCTHLINTKKPDVRVFFGMNFLGGAGAEDNFASTIKMDHEGVEEGTEDDAEWEVWPEDERGDQTTPTGEGGACGSTSQPQRRQLQPVPAVHDKGPGPLTAPPPRLHGKEIAPNPERGGRGQPELRDEWWPCPVCFRRQPADERLFNSHIDACLSRRAILEAVHDSALEGRRLAGGASQLSPDKGKADVGTEKKRGRPAAVTMVANDPRQKKICFGAPTAPQPRKC